MDNYKINIVEKDNEITLKCNHNHNDKYSYLQARQLLGTIHITRSGKHYGNKILIVGTLYVQQKYRGKGIGSMLLKCLIEYCKQHNICKIVLDDMTDYYRQPNNIYLKHGFKYVNETGPEMEFIY